MVCRSSGTAPSALPKTLQLIKRLTVATAMACGLLIKAARHPVRDMIAQQIHTATTNAKTQAAQQPSAAANGFLSALSATNSSLSDLTQNTGTAAAGVVTQAANSNKSAKTADLTTTSYIPVAPATPLPSAPLVDAAAAAANAKAAVLPSNAVMPASAAPASTLALIGATAGAATAPGATTAAAGAGTTPGASTAGDAGTTAAQTPTANGNSTDFGNQVNARIVAGAPIYTAQPSANLATVPPHVIEQANPKPQTGATPATDGDDATPKLSQTLAGTPAHGLGPSGTPLAASAAAASPSDSIAAKPGSAPNPQPAAPDAGTSDAAPAMPTPSLNHAATTSATGTFVGAASAATAAAPDDSTADDTDASGTAGATLVAQPNDPSAAPAQLDAATHIAAPYVPVGEQVALNVKQALATENNDIRIQLKPESLGTIDVKLNLTHDGRLSAVITADRSDTLNMLKQDSGTLQQSLRDAGINADSGSLSFNLRGDAQSFAQNSSQGGSSHSGGYAATASSVLAGVDAATPSQRVHSGTLDIEV